MNDETPRRDRDPAEPRKRASGERPDHQASPPGVALPGEPGGAQDGDGDEDALADEPDPGEHPMP